MVHPDVAQVVDSLVRGVAIRPEIRWRTSTMKFMVEKAAAGATGAHRVPGWRQTDLYQRLRNAGGQPV